MKIPPTIFKSFACSIGLLLLVAGFGQAQVLLTGTQYTQNFDTLGNAIGSVNLPTGWSWTNDTATASALGTLLTSVTRNNWSTTTGGAWNFASTAGLTSASNNAAQDASTNRAFGYRQTNTQDPSASFNFNFNSTGFELTSLSFDFLTLDISSRTTTWLLQVSVNGTTWVDLATSPAAITDAATWGSVTFSASSIPSLVDNVASGYIRLAALTTSSGGGGSRDAIAIDNFQLNYTAVPEPSVFGLLAVGFVGIGVNRRFRCRKECP